VAEQDALIAAIVADPKSDATWRAYADALGDDPRAAWIREALASGDDVISRRPPKDEERFMSPRLAEHWHLVELQWWRGFITGFGLTGAMDDPPTFETIEAVFDDPHAGLLSSVDLTHPVAATVPLWQALVVKPRPTVRTLIVSNLGAGGARLDALPALERLVFWSMSSFELMYAATRVPVGELRHATLPELHANACAAPALITGNFDLPRLESLIWDTLASPKSAHECTELFTSRNSIANRPPPGLRTLLVGYMGNAEPLKLDMLAESAVLPQLAELHWNGSLLVEEVIAHADQLRHLEELSFRAFCGTDEVIDERRAILEHAFPNTKLDVRWWGRRRRDLSASRDLH
jgi:hypothetical protein